MLLAVDAGNSSVSFGVFRDEEILTRFFVPYGSAPPTAETLREQLRQRGVDPAAIFDVAFSNVGPHGAALEQTLRQSSAARVLPLSVDPALGMPVAYPVPQQLGVDRWLNGLAAFDRCHGAAIIVDIGTATNFDCVSASGEFLGGAISIGPQLSLDALSRRSSKLAPLTLAIPPSALANNTHDALQSGAYHGHAAMIDGMITRLTKELATDVTVFGTGGYISLFASACPSIDVIDEALTLRGARLAWQRSYRV